MVAQSERDAAMSEDHFWMGRRRLAEERHLSQNIDHVPEALLIFS